MLFMHRSNDAQVLAVRLASLLQEKIQHPFEEILLATPDGMQEWLKRELAQQQTVFLGSVQTPRSSAEKLILALSDDGAETFSKYSTEAVMFAICHILERDMDDPLLAPLKMYLGNDATAARHFSLAATLAALWYDYVVYRPLALNDWKEESVRWQAVLFQRVCALLEGEHFGAAALRAITQCTSGKNVEANFPKAVYLFGISSMPPLLLNLFAAASLHIDVVMFVIAPSEAYISDIGLSVRDTQHHPLLQFLGRQPAQFQSLLLEMSSRIPFEEHDEFVLDCKPTILGQLQQGIVTDSNANNTFPVAPADSSVQFHECTTPMRELEVAKDVLMDLVESSHLQPSDILVMAPQIGDYADYIESVFHPSSLPFDIVDGSHLGSVAFIEGVRTLLDLIDSRFGLAQVFGFLSVEFVAKKFELDAAEIKVAYEWFKKAGVRTGIDAEHRESLGLAVFKENTWQFGLERLFLGYAMDDSALYHGVAPLPGFVGTEASILGRVANFLQTLFSLARKFRIKKSVEQWSTQFLIAIYELFDSAEHLASLESVREITKQIEGGAKKVQFDTMVDFGAFRKLIQARLSAIAVPRMESSGIRFSSMKHSRGVFVKVVYLLGLQEKAFPLEDQMPSFNILSMAPQPGDRDAKQDSYHMLLEALLCAKEKLIISYHTTGSGVAKSGLSTAGHEIFNEVNRQLAPNIRSEYWQRCHLEHPAAPFHPVYFDTENPSFFSYSYTDYCAASRMANPKQLPQKDAVSQSVIECSSTGVLDSDGQGEAIPLGDFLRFWKQPVSYYLERTLGMRENQPVPQPADEEPWNLVNLDKWRVGQSLVDMMGQGESRDYIVAMVRSNGIVPPGNWGKVLMEEVFATADLISTRVKSIVQKQPRDTLWVDVSFPLSNGDVRLGGNMEGVFGDRLVEYGFRNFAPHQILHAWIRHLVILCGMPTPSVPTAIAIYKNQSGLQQYQFNVEPAAARTYLQRLVELYLGGEKSPVFFEPELSYELARKTQGADSTVQIKMAAQMNERLKMRLQNESDITSRAYLDMGLLDNNEQLRTIAIDVFIPLLENMKKFGKK